MPQKIRKRDGRIVDFDRSKIANAVFKAFIATKNKDGKRGEDIANQVVEIIDKRITGIPGVEDIQDIVEEVLIKNGYAGVAKAYILYREKRAQIRKAKEFLGVRDELKLSVNAVRVLERRYLLKDEKGNVTETPLQLFRRIAKAVALDPESEGDFLDVLVNLEFLPNTPTLMNAGTDLGQLSACFVIPVEDSLISIFDAVKSMALIQQSGGGTGFSFTRLRPAKDIVRTTHGVASGPVSFMRIFDTTTDVIKQGGKRRGANMGILRADHPDIIDFITAKTKEGFLANFNISVAVDDKFMRAVKEDREYELINPRNREVVKKVRAREIWNLIITMAWRTGDPGVVFIDEINRHNPTPHIGEMESTNPCVIGSTLISTENGLMRMKDLVEKYPEGGIKIAVDNKTPINIVNYNGTISLMQSKQSGVKFNEISKAFCVGVRKTYKIETESGYELLCTADHKVLTNEGWVKVSALDKSKHRVQIQSGEGKFGENYELPFGVRNEFVGGNGKITRLNLPDKWSKELGRVIGWLIGDGWLRDGDKNCRVGFTFSKEDREVMNYLKPIINLWYGYDINEVQRGNEVYHLSYHSKYFVDFFNKLGVKSVDAENKTVPESIFTAPKEVVIGFLQGLFTADGTVNFIENHSSYTRLTSKSQRLLKDVQILLLNLGIKSRIYNRSRTPRENTFSYLNKKGELKKYSSSGMCYELEISRESVIRFLKEIGFLCELHKNKINKFFTKGFYSDTFEERIKYVKVDGEELVYDLTEPKRLSFISNGIVSFDCGEQPLLPYESCNLGSINLAKMVKGGSIDWEKLEKTVNIAVKFLDNVIDINKYPLSQTEEITRANRKIGLGVMGFADMLVQLGIPYDSPDALATGEKIMGFIQEKSHAASERLAGERGAFPNFHGSIYKTPIRNSTVTTVAPTGTISIIAGCSSGIEPLFAVSFVRNVMEGTKLFEVNPFFETVAKERGFYSEELIMKIARTGRLAGIEEVPEDIRRVFVTAFDVRPEWHVKMQAVFQKHCDNAVSKTINFPNDVDIKDVERAFMLAYELKCKGITVYRYGSKAQQVLYLGNITEKYVSADDEYAGGCPAPVCPV
ncbi:Vitamin B12-dependent ribonucleoside-diphosphate reductase [uncultured archaeon]|nr:Vitamin B12-dependent ribonucleoside-diphosphate reductase [uncultured archaeon]